MGMKELLTRVKELITIEPLICCVVAARMLCVPALTNLNFEKACKVNAGFNETVCDAIVLGTYLKLNFREQNNEVQLYLTHMRSWEIPVSSVVPVLLVLFLGSYSDRHNIRKPFLLMPILGDMIALVGSALNVRYMTEWPLEAQTVAEKIIPSLFGTEKLQIMVSLAYIADISTSETRTIRMAIIPILLSVCVPIVQALSGILFHAVGYIPIFCVSFALYIIAFFYGVFIVKEPKKVNKKNKKLIGDCFNTGNISEPFKLLIKTEGPQRNNLICTLVVYYIHTTVESGELNAFFLFTQTAYQWTVVDYSYFTMAVTIINFIGLSVALPFFTKVLHLNDLIIIKIALLNAILVGGIYMASKSPIGLYIGCALSILIPPGQTATKSQLTKFVPSEDIAKVLSLNTVVSAIASSLSALIYHRGIYEHTHKTFPQAFFLFGIALRILGTVIVLWMYYKERSNLEKNKDLITEQEKQKEVMEEQNQLGTKAFVIERQVMVSETKPTKEFLIDCVHREKQTVALHTEDTYM